MSAEELKKEVEKDVHKKNKLLETLLAFGVLLVAVGLIGYGIFSYLDNNQTSDSGSLLTYKKEKTETKSAATTTVATTTGVKYTNSQFGFNLTMPITWKDYGIHEVRPDNNYEVKTIYIGLPSEKIHPAFESGEFEHNYSNLIAISVFTKEQWAALQKEEGPKPTLLKENGTYIFAYSFGNGVPDAKGFTVAQIQADQKTIIASFKLN